MKRYIASACLALALLAASLACSVVSVSIFPTSTPLPLPPGNTPIPPTAIPEQPVIDTPTPLPTLTPTLEPTAVPTRVRLPQEWRGTYNYPATGSIQSLMMIIEEVKGTKFTGKMIWFPFANSRGATLKMNGEYVTDFGDELQLARWGHLEDYKNGETSGTWLKWTETEILVGRNYTVNGWYYAHIREDGTMVAIYYYNSTERTPDAGKFVFELKKP